MQLHKVLEDFIANSGFIINKVIKARGSSIIGYMMGYMIELETHKRTLYGPRLKTEELINHAIWIHPNNEIIELWESVCQNWRNHHSTINISDPKCLDLLISKLSTFDSIARNI